jgi:hypothetical protein
MSEAEWSVSAVTLIIDSHMIMRASARFFIALASKLQELPCQPGAQLHAAWQFVFVIVQFETRFPDMSM